MRYFDDHPEMYVWVFFCGMLFVVTRGNRRRFAFSRHEVTEEAQLVFHILSVRQSCACIHHFHLAGTSFSSRAHHRIHRVPRDPLHSDAPLLREMRKDCLYG